MSTDLVEAGAQIAKNTGLRVSYSENPGQGSRGLTFEPSSRSTTGATAPSLTGAFQQPAAAHRPPASAPDPQTVVVVHRSGLYEDTFSGSSGSDGDVGGPEGDKLDSQRQVIAVVQSSGAERRHGRGGGDGFNLGKTVDRALNSIGRTVASLTGAFGGGGGGHFARHGGVPEHAFSTGRPLVFTA